MTSPSLLPPIDQIRASLARDEYREDPVKWVQEKLKEHPWSVQREIMRSVRDNRRTAVRSCHSSGKSWIASRIVAWWLDGHAPGEAFVVTSAPTGDQVKAILWREINRAHAKGDLSGRLNQTEWWMDMPTGKEEIVAFGRKPNDMNMSAFQGIHALYVLVVFDEACGMTPLLWEAADTLISNEYSKILAIGNPDDPSSEFAEINRPGSGWKVFRIQAFDTPNFTGEEVPSIVSKSLLSPIWVEEKRRKWGEDNPLYTSKILAEFPETTEDGLIPVSWIQAAQRRTLEPEEPSVLGVDVGGGGDLSIIAHRRGPVVRIVSEDHNPDTMQTTGKVVMELKRRKAEQANVDYIGIGRGVVDRGKEQKLPFNPINVGQKARDPESFVNLRAEEYWRLRDLFQSGEIDIDPADEDLAAQLADLRYKRTSAGKIQMESKEEMKRRGKSSPDRADSVMLAFAQGRRRRTKATWGR